MKPLKKSAGTFLQNARVVVALIATTQMIFGPLVQNVQAEDKTVKDAAASLPTASPIKHVIVIVGENRSFDHLFATYQPINGNTVNNLFSEGIVQADGSPGPNYSKAVQYSADITGSPVFELAPTSGKAAYVNEPAPLNGGPTDVCAEQQALLTWRGLQLRGLFVAQSAQLLPIHVDGWHWSDWARSRQPHHRSLAGAPLLHVAPGTVSGNELTRRFPYDSYANSPVHRLFQMWQQEDCDISHATTTNPSGCLADYFTWTEVTVGSNNNGKAQPSPFCTRLHAWLRWYQRRRNLHGASTTCSRAMRRTPSTSPTTTP